MPGSAQARTVSTLAIIQAVLTSEKHVTLLLSWREFLKQAGSTEMYVQETGNSTTREYLRKELQPDCSSNGLNRQIMEQKAPFEHLTDDLCPSKVGHGNQNDAVNKTDLQSPGSII